MSRHKRKGVDLTAEIPISSSTKLYGQIREHKELLLAGTVLSVDPSCGSLSSMPGYAVHINGILVGSGIIQLDPAQDLGDRLCNLRIYLAHLQKVWNPDILIYEEIASRAFNGRAASGHASLLKSVGVVLASVEVGGRIGMRPNIWKKLVRPSYRKSDEGDAIEMGFIAIDLARKIPAKKGKRKNEKQEQ